MNVTPNVPSRRRAAGLDPSFIVAACASVLIASCATLPGSQAAPALIANGVLTTQSGMTLYTFDRDAAASGKSACNGACAANWPAFVASSDNAATGDWTVVQRDDGGRQWAYKGKPLYTFVKDAKAGDRTGNDVNGVWHLAKP